MWIVTIVLDSAYLLRQIYVKITAQCDISGNRAMYYGTQDSVFILPISLVHVTTRGTRYWDLEMSW